MNMLKELKNKIKNVLFYIQGNVRYRLYYSKLNFLLPIHIKEQFELRISIMNKLCYKEGSCVICGCETTKLQMANKSCDRPCYPPMMDKLLWGKFSFILKLISEVYKDHYIGDKRQMVSDAYDYAIGKSFYKLHRVARKSLYDKLSENELLYNK